MPSAIQLVDTSAENQGQDALLECKMSAVYLLDVSIGPISGVSPRTVVPPPTVTTPRTQARKDAKMAYIITLIKRFESKWEEGLSYAPQLFPIFLPLSNDSTNRNVSSRTIKAAVT